MDRLSSQRRGSIDSDIKAFLVGIVFLLVYMFFIFWLGALRGWDATSGYNHNLSLSSQKRFLPEPFDVEKGVFGRDGLDATSRWYYWKVPPLRVTLWTRALPWVGYVLHQVTVWATIYYAQLVKAKEPLGDGRYSANLRSFNKVALGLHFCFHLLHLLNTHTTYDGIAQDTPVATSQGSVTMLLMLILIMEYRDRGIAFGWPTASDKGAFTSALRLDPAPVNLVRRYHGYAFAWAAVYTFWYHPMENTMGHALGLTYTFIILLQGSLMYTNMHLNRFVRLFNESWVIVHGGLVAFQTGGPSQWGTKLWPIFTFGPGMMFFSCHIFILPFWRRLPRVVRFLPAAAFLSVCVWAYSWIPDANGNPTRFKEVYLMPAFHLMCFIYGYGISRALLFIEKHLLREQLKEVAEATPGLGKQVVYIMSSVGVYGFFVWLAVHIHYADLHIGLIAMMSCFVAVYLMGVMLSFVLLKQVTPKRIQTGEVKQKSS